MEILPTIAVTLLCRYRYLNRINLSRLLNATQTRFLKFETQLVKSNLLKLRNLNVIYSSNIVMYNTFFYFCKEITQENMFSGAASGVFLMKLFCVKNYLLVLAGGISNGLINEAIFRFTSEYKRYLFDSANEEDN